MEFEYLTWHRRPSTISPHYSPTPYPRPLAQTTGLPTALKTHFLHSHLWVSLVLEPFSTSSTLSCLLYLSNTIIFLVTQLFKADISLNRGCDSQGVKWFHLPNELLFHLKSVSLKMLPLTSVPTSVSPCSFCSHHTVLCVISRVVLAYSYLRAFALAILFTSNSVPQRRVPWLTPYLLAFFSNVFPHYLHASFQMFSYSRGLF